MRKGNFSKILGTGVAGAGGLLAYLFVIRPWHLHWGLTDDEVSRTLPGDELVPQPRQEATKSGPGSCNWARAGVDGTVTTGWRT